MRPVRPGAEDPAGLVLAALTSDEMKKISCAYWPRPLWPHPRYKLRNVDLQQIQLHWSLR